MFIQQLCSEIKAISFLFLSLVLDPLPLFTAALSTLSLAPPSSTGPALAGPVTHQPATWNLHHTSSLCPRINHKCQYLLLGARFPSYQRLQTAFFPQKTEPMIFPLLHRAHPLKHLQFSLQVRALSPLQQKQASLVPSRDPDHTGALPPS